MLERRTKKRGKGKKGEERGGKWKKEEERGGKGRKRGGKGREMGGKVEGEGRRGVLHSENYAGGFVVA